MKNRRLIFYIFSIFFILHFKAAISFGENDILAANKVMDPKAKSITLTSPNGGEIWQAGTEQVIKWNSSEVAFVDISYSTDNGLNWNNITTGYAASWQQYWWTIPENITPSQEFRIQVSENGNPALFDISDNKLTLTKMIITAPGPSISFQTGRVDTIKWVASSDIDSIDIEISFNNGSFTTIKRVDASLGKYLYTVPDNPSRFNKIKIKNYDKPTFSYTTDYFRIARLNLSSPNGGENWFNGTSHPITWNSLSVTTVKLEYSTDAGVSWNNIVNNYSATPNSYNWTVPNVGTSTGLIRISDSNEPGIYDISNNYYSLTKLFITTPDDSTGWKVGNSVNIQWSTNITDNVKLEISTNNGANWSEIATNIPGTNQSYTYLVSNTPTNEGKIRITSLTNSNYTYVSDGTFTIGNITLIAPNGVVWQAGTQQNITWSYSGIRLVKLEYTTDNGTNWLLINSSYEASSGSYPWSIPSTLASTNVKIRISDAETNSGGLQSVSSSFTVSNLQITSPLNADVFKSGAVVNITWTSSSTISNIRLAYKTENDADWQPINNNNPIQASLGSYNWTTPANLSGQYCQIRLTTTDTPSNSVISDGYFRVGYLNLVKPNGGEKLIGNGIYQIKWNGSSSIQYVRLEYSLDGGINYITIPGGFEYPASGGTFSWQVPNVVNGTAKVRISDAYAPITINDQSDNSFSIAELTLTYPNGGEGFLPGQPITITWSSTNISNINLSYRAGSGNWTNIIQGISSAPKQYNWIIPNTISSDFDIKISATEDTSLYDISDGKCKIANVKVKYPNLAGEIFQVGKKKKIQWSYSNNVNSVNIEVSTDNGINWNYITTRPAADSVYEWTIPYLPSTQALIRITDADNSAITDLSDNTFTIKALELVYPNGKEYFLADSTINIRWSSANVANVKISYSVDSLQNWLPITTLPSLPAFYSWKIPNNPSNRVLVKIEDADNIPLDISDISDGKFSIGTIQLSSPNGGQSFVVGSKQLVSWQAHSSVQKVRIELTSNGGSSWSVVKDSLASVPSSYLWTVPNVRSTNCRIRVIDVANPTGLTTRDQSDTTFAIGSILLTSPNGSERYQVGSKKNITWVNINSVLKVNLDYSTNNGINWINIVSNYDAPLESYEWTIPNVNVPGNHILVRVSNVADTVVNDVSDSPFSIANIIVNSPNGSEVYQVGKNLAINWTSWNVDYVQLQYSNDNGITWNNINGSISSSEGQYNSYILPDIPSTQALVRIVDNADATILDRSDNTFKVLRLNLTSPDGGESYKIGTTKTISWNSSGIPIVDLKYSIDDGVNWTNIISNYVAATGSYNWLVPNLPTNNLKIKIYDVANPFVSDSSSNPLTLGIITVSQPIAGEVLRANSVKTIEWTASPGITAVKLEFSHDNGATWETIENSIPAQTGAYNWIVKDVATASALIKVSHAISPTDILDLSDNFIISKLMVNLPNGGEYWQAGTTKNITWSSSVAGNVKLEYSLNNGASWNIIASPVAANLGSYTWTIPANLSSSQALVKVTDLLNTVIKDSSDAVFKIGNVSITNVFGGENWQTNSSKTINFTASGSINTVNFEYTLDGITWTPFALGVSAASGSVVWNIDNISSSIQAKIRVSDAESGLNISYTTNNFNIIKLNINSPNGDELLQAGKTATISWQSSSQVPFVNIFYSTDNGLNWVQIANNVLSPANVINTYSWSVPSNIVGENNRIKIVSSSDGTINTTSLNKFTIGSLDFTNPTVNSIWQTNKRYKIEWNSQLIGDVKLEYSLDNGTTWNNIINSYNSSLHFYNWDIPVDSYSNQAQVRIVSNKNALVNETTAPFTLKRLEVKIPNGGETWKAGTPRTITWDANYVNSVTLYISSDNGQTWDNTPIAKNISGNGGQHSWLIPVNYSGKNYKIKIVDDEVSSVRDSSSTPFTINSFALTSPIGGEIWQAGTTKTIKWTVSNVNEVFLEYSLDNGTTWNSIISNLNAELKQYDWLIPNNISSNQARIKITDHQDNNNYYISNPFTINKLSVTSPNGGELWQAGTSHAVTWNSAFINNVTLEYSVDNGVSWVNIASGINAALGTYNWLIPSGISSANVRVKISDSDNSSYYDICDSKFVIGNMEITNPAASSQFQAGKTCNIAWTISNIGLIDLYYSIDDGVSWNILGTNINSNSTTSFLWDIPSNISSDKAKIKIQSVNDPALNIVSGAFRISNLAITSPNLGNIIWKSGDINTITWNYNFVDNIKLEYTSNGGTSWNTIVNSIAAATGTYNWQTPNNLSGELKLRISDAANSNIYDENDNTFSLRYIYVTNPNGGEVVQVGIPFTIKYSYSSNVSLVNILYSDDNGTTWNTITSGPIVANGEYNYTFPSNSLNTTTGLIRIVDANASAIVNDQSDAVFTLSTLLLTSPNGNEQFQVGKTTNITWSAGPTISKIALEYFTETKGWKLIVDNVAANLGTYTWTIPNDPSNVVKVRIKNMENTTVNDISDATFRIADIAVAIPNTDLKWQVGKSKIISWTKTSNVKYVNIEYSIDGGLTWKPPIAVSDSSVNNQFKWLVVNDTTLTAKIRVTDASSNGNIFDISDVNFVISKLEVNQPDGALPILSGSTQEVKWVSTRDIDSVYIKLSMDNGTTWSTLYKEKANKGKYTWSVPSSANTDNAYILVQDTKEETIIDTSNKFKILPANLTLTYPVGGENLQEGRSYNIRWTRTNAVQRIKIEITTNNGTNWTTIESNYPADSLKYSYTIPNGYFSNNAKVRITDALNSFVSSSSNSTFNIYGLTLTSFNQVNQHYKIGDTKAITWQSTNNVNQINIEYSTTEGVWKPIASNIAANLGTYNWIIPNDPSNTIKVRLTYSQTSEIYSISANSFRTANVVVVNPNIIKKLQVGRTEQIKWISTSNATNINLYYSIDNGLTWKSIQDNINSTPSVYNWVVPDDTTLTAKIKIVDAISGGLISDESDVNFVISKLEVNQPDGTLPLLSGSTQEVKWVSTRDIDSVYIKLSMDNGTTWSTLYKEKANKGKYTWNVPSSANTDNAYILVQDTKEETIIDTSNKFKILPANLTLSYPVGGENLQEGRSYNIRWTRTNAVQRIKIEITTNNGTNWTTIESNYPADSLKYSYTIPNGYFSNTAKIRITDALNSFVSSSSNNTFNIYGLTLTSFNQANQHYKIGDTKAITWQSTNNVNQINIEYSTTEGVWKPIASNVAANLGTYNWIIPNDPSNTIKVRLTYSQTSEIYSISANSFRTANVVVVNPNIIKKLQVGRTEQIKWISTSNATNLNLYYSIDNGLTWKSIQDNVNSTPSIYNWIVPDDTTLTAKIKIVDAISGGLISDESDVNFVISKLEVNQPDGALPILSGSTQEVKWVSTRDIDSVYIKLSMDNGTTWSTLYKEKANKGKYTWSVPSSANTDNAYILVQDTKEETIIDTSNKFKILPANLTLTYPVGGENLQEGRSYNIRWTRTNAVQRIKIEITTNNGTNWTTIESNYPADSLKYSYTIPNGYFSNNAKVRITDALNSFVSSSSNSTFNIYGLTLTSFNQVNQHYKIGDTKAITWQSTNNVNQINIEYSTTEGVWKPIASNVAANLGTYDWIIPNDPSNTIKVRLTYSQTSEIYSISANSFRTANVVVVNPNIFGKLQVNRTEKIKWNYTNNVTSVNLYYSTNNGTSWIAIGNKGIEAAGEYIWTIPDYPSTTALIKVEDNSAPNAINDISDTSFVISKLEVTKPQANDIWASGDIKQIEWTSSNDIDTVGIYITLDGGSVWSSLVKVKASQNNYSWTIPYAINSSNVRILVNDSKFTNVNDTTDKFTIYPPLLKVVTPNGGEYIQGGKNYQISWQSSPDVKNVRIQYRVSPSSSWISVVQSYPADSLKMNWNVPQITTDSAQIKITDVLQPFITDSSDNIFKVGFVTVLEPNGGEHVQAGKEMLIRWSNSTNISNVKIEYSIDGVNYSTIKNSIAAALGNYTWQIPNLSSTTAYIRVSDAASNNTINDTNDNPFVISLLQLTTPSSNIQLQAGTNYLIEWNASSEIQNVNLEYSIDGTTWNRISTVSANLGEYNWLIPNNLCAVSGKLRIWDNSAYNIIDTSKYQITFKQLNIVLPMGNENWQVGTSHEIQWSSCLVDTINIEYSINNGLSWLRVIDNVVANTGKYNWIIPNTPSQNVLIRLVDKTNPTLLSMSNRFAIFNPSIKLLEPNGGEIWQAGSSKTITWQSSNVNYVKVEFSSDSGKTWSVLRSSIQADSFFVWNPVPPNLETKGAMVKITDVMNSHIKDSSLAFTITQLKLLAPLGGEYWQSGTTQKIKWHAGNGINTINLEYSLNSGQSWETIEGAQNYIASADSFAWNIPTTGSNAVKVRIRETYDGTINSVSPDTFTIGWVNVVSPNGGEVVQAGLPLNIRWQNSDNIHNVKVEIYNEPKNQVVAWTEVASSLKQINIVIPANLSSDSLKIRLSASNSNYSIIDYSNNYFSCMMLNLLTPVVGSNWRALTEKNITWEASSNNNTVKLEFSSDAGVTWNNIVTNIPASQFNYIWTVPNNVSSNCLVRILNEEFPNIKDSSGIFTIYIPEVTLLTPNGSEYYQVGKTYKIKWDHLYLTTLKIEYSSDNGSTWEVIKNQIAANAREWDWNIVNKNWSTGSGLIRISDYSDPNIKDVSMANFTVGWIDVLAPDGGENWMSNSSKTIKWDNSNSVSFVNIYYNSGIDTNWIQLAVNYQASLKEFNWQQVPSVETNRGKIKITDALSGGEIVSLSQNYFLITKLYVIEPNGGEVYYKGNTYQIKWTPSININAVKIFLSVNGGNSYEPLEPNSISSQLGYYNWKILDNYYSDSAKIKIVNAEDSTIFATSQGLFTLGNLQLLVFNNAEKVLEKSVKTIAWECSQNISRVDLYYWTKNKIKRLIASDVVAGNKSYNWRLPEEVSDSCYIAIYDHNNYRFFDTSNAPFTICRLKLLNPKGGEVWKLGDSKEFVWESEYINKVNIEFITDDSTSVPIFSDSPYKINDLPINATLGRFTKVIDRNILGMVSSKHVRIRLIESSSKEKLSDTCDQALTTSEILLTYPNEGEHFGKVDSIKWECSTNTIENVNIWYKRDDLTNWRLIASNVPANSDSYKWYIKNIDPAQNYRIKIEDANPDPKYRAINDLSDETFTICDINLTYPNGNEKLKVGKIYQIKWNSSFINLIRLEYSIDDGNNWYSVSADPISAAQQTFDWTIPSDFSRKVRLRVSDYDKSLINDMSDTTFTIADIRLLNPNELMALNSGTDYTIKWESQNVDTVRIQLSTDNGRNWIYNLKTIPSDSGKYIWNVQPLLSSAARIRVLDINEANISDTSNSHFVIGKFPTVKVVKINQSSIIKFFYEFLTPQETILIDRFEFQVGDGPIINNTESLINPPFSITGPINDTLYWRSSDKLNNMEGVTKIYVRFRSPQFNVYYDVLIDSVAYDNKAPDFDRNSVSYYQLPEKYGWNKVIVKWNKGTDLSSNIYYKLYFYDINNEYLNYSKVTKDDSLIISDVTTSVKYKVKLDIYDDFKNTSNFALSDYGAIALGDFAPHDGILDARDLSTFVYMWSSKDSTTGVDFAPYDGTFPYIKVRGDNKLDVDDLLAFVNNWNYAQEFTLPKKNQYVSESDIVERKKITFKTGENKFNFPINFEDKELLAVSAVINYPVGTFEFDSLSVSGLSKNNGLAFIKVDSLNGFAKLDFAELYNGLKGNYGIDANLKCSFDKLNKKDSLSIRYIGYKASGIKVFDKTVVYTLNEVPASYKLYQNYPNPFNPSTTIEYDLPEKTKVNLTVFDILGREVAVLINEEQEVGTYRLQFDSGKIRNGLASGVYLLRMSTDNYKITKKMLLLK